MPARPIEGISLDQFEGSAERRFALLPRRLDHTLGSLLLPKHITVLHGINRAPMSALAHHVCLSAARRGLRGVYIDSGTNYSADLARRFLLNWKAPVEVSENIALVRPRGLHGLDGIISSIRAMKDIGIIVLDSLTGALNETVPPASKGRQRFLFTLLESLRELVNDTGSHVLLTDHSSVDWQREERRPQGGNVLQHGVDSIVHVSSLDVEKNLVSLMVDRTSVVPAPNGAVFKIDHNGIKTMKGV